MADQKAASERALLDEFLEISRLFTDRDVHQRERPDFELRPRGAGAGLIGIELTKFLSGERRRGGAVERESEVVCARFRERIAAALSGDQQRHGLLRFQKHGRVPGKGDNRFSEELRRLLDAHREDCELDAHDLRDGGFAALSEYLARLWIRAPDELRLDQPWDCVDCNAGPVGIRVEELRASLATKKTAAVAYRAAGFAGELVLLITAAGINISECSGEDWRMPEICQQLQAEMAALSFDRIYFYSRDGGWAYQLHPTAGEVGRRRRYRGALRRRLRGCIIGALMGSALAAALGLLDIYSCPTCGDLKMKPGYCLPCNGDGRVNLIQLVRWKGRHQP